MQNDERQHTTDKKYDAGFSNQQGKLFNVMFEILPDFVHSDYPALHGLAVLEAIERTWVPGLHPFVKWVIKKVFSNDPARTILFFDGLFLGFFLSLGLFFLAEMVAHAIVLLI